MKRLENILNIGGDVEEIDTEIDNQIAINQGAPILQHEVPVYGMCELHRGRGAPLELAPHFNIPVRKQN